MKMKHPIDLHKGSTAFVVLALMTLYDNFSIGPWVYLALHGSYGFMWVLKSNIFPDRAWEIRVPWWKGMGIFLILLLYWIAPLILIRSGSQPPPWLISAAVSLNLMGVFLHFASDAQKHYVLQQRPGLISNGFFARNRNPNYLGEIFIYVGFAMLTQHWLPFAILGLFVAAIFVPNMLRKDRSMSRHEEFAAYRGRSGMLFFRFW